MDVDDHGSESERPYFNDLLCEIRDMRRQNMDLRKALEEANKTILSLKDRIGANESSI